LTLFLVEILSCHREKDKKVIMVKGKKMRVYLLLSFLLILLTACQRENTPYAGIKEDKSTSPQYTYTPDVNRMNEAPK